MSISGHTIALEEARTSARRIFSIIASELEQVEAEFERQARSHISENTSVHLAANECDPR